MSERVIIPQGTHECPWCGIVQNSSLCTVCKRPCKVFDAQAKEDYFFRHSIGNEMIARDTEKRFGTKKETPTISVDEMRSKLRVV